MGGVLVPANTLLYGTVRIEGQRMAVTVKSIESGGNILPVELAATVVGRYQKEAERESPLDSEYRDQGKSLEEE